MFRDPEDLKILQIPLQTTVYDAVKALDEGRFGVVVVVDERGIFAGIMTNGDFRKFILAGGRLDEPIRLAMNASPVVVTQGPNLERELEGCFGDRNIRYVPVLDHNRSLMDLALASDMSGVNEERGGRLPRGCPVLIMAGGKGIRLDPFTRILPKALIPVGDTPVIELIMDRFAAHGIDSFWLSVHHKARMIQAFFQEATPRYHLQFLQERRPLGTAGALSLLKGNITRPLFITNCDLIILANYESIYKEHCDKKNDITIVGSMRRHTVPYGVCEIENGGRLLRLVEKPSYEMLVNTGMYVVSPPILDLVEIDEHIDMNDLIARAMERGHRVGVYPVSEGSWLDVGQWEEYKRAVRDLDGSGHDG